MISVRRLGSGALICALSAGWIALPSLLPAASSSIGTMWWADPESMHLYYSARLAVYAGGGSFPHTAGKFPGRQEVTVGGVDYELDQVQLIGLRSDGMLLTSPTTELDRLGWRWVTPAEHDAIDALSDGADVVALLTQDRPRVLGQVRIGPQCVACHTEPLGTVRGFLAYSLLVPAAELESYDFLVRRLERGHAVDLNELRWSFTRWKRYTPESTQNLSQRRQLQERARKAGWHSWVADHCVQALKETWVDIATHRACAEGYAQLGDHARAAHHAWLADGLLETVLASGDGTEESPYVPITHDEISDVLDARGHSLGECERSYVGGESYVSCVVSTPGGATEEVWFQTTLIEEWIGTHGR